MKSPLMRQFERGEITLANQKDIEHKEWFSKVHITYGEDFKDEDFQPGMMFMYRTYYFTLGEMQILKKDKLVAIVCAVESFISFKACINIEVIKKAIYISSTLIERR